MGNKKTYAIFLFLLYNLGSFPINYLKKSYFIDFYSKFYKPTDFF